MFCVENSENSKAKNRQMAIQAFGEKNPACILLAEDDYEMRALLAISIRRAGYKVVTCPDGWRLLQHLEAHILPGSEHEKVDLVISDIRMPGVTGMELLRGLPQGQGYPPIILITAFGDMKTHQQAEQFGVAAMFDKPFEINDLLTKIREIVPL